MTLSRFGLALVALCGMAAPTLAQDNGMKQLGTFKSWTAWTGSDANGVMCYISAEPEDWQPKEANGNPVKRDPIHFLVINRKALGTKNEVQTLVGYPLSTSVAITVAIDGNAYPMIVEGEAAWLANESDEPTFVEAMKGGSKLVVNGTSQRGTKLTDTYNLSGVTAALGEITKACS
jgi:hypothetical protein